MNVIAYIFYNLYHGPCGPGEISTILFIYLFLLELKDIYINVISG